MMSILLICFAAVCKGVNDKLLFHFSSSIFRNFGSFWNPAESWRNKWKNGDKDQGEAFLFSSTLLVGFTDAWHLFNSFQWSFIIVSILTYEPITKYIFLDFLIYRLVAYAFVFHLFFTYVFNINTMKKIFPILLMIFFISCSPGKDFINTYNYALENPDLSKRVGYIGLPCTIVSDMPVVDCIFILETYENFKFNERYRFTLASQGYFGALIKPGKYFPTIIIEGKSYNNFVFNSYLPAWEVDINILIETANEEHKRSILLANKTK